MRIKRVLQGTALTALAAAAWMGAGTIDASAAAFDSDNISVWLDSEDGGTPYMYVDAPNGCKEIMFGVASYNATNGVKIADTAWDVHDVDPDDGGVYIDLSKLSITKDNYVAVKSESSEPVYIKIGASVTSQKVTYDALKNTVTFDIKKSANSASVDNTVFEYRTPYGYWSRIDCYDWKVEDGEKPKLVYNKDKTVFQEFQYQGASLYIRAQGQSTGLQKVDAGVKDATDKEGKKTFELYTAGVMPGKESKLSIAKQANGPSVSADYVNGKVNIPAKTEYRVLATDGSISEKVIDNGSKTSVDVAELLKKAYPDNTPEANVATSGTIEVRKVATAKKPASKWTRVAIEIPDPIALKAIEGMEVGKAVLTSTKGSVDVAEGISIEPTKKKGKDEYSGSITVTVKGDAINVQIGTAKAVKVDNKKAKSIKAAVGAEIKISKAGDKKAKTWASGYVTVGSVSDK